VNYEIRVGGNNMGAFAMKYDTVKKVFNVSVEGLMSLEDAGRFIEEYKKNVAKFNAKEYTLDLDGTKLAVSRPETLPMLEQCYKMYMADGFKKIIFKISKNPTLKMQLGRIARSTGLEYEIVEV
jgi:hypothetical protein